MVVWVSYYDELLSDQSIRKGLRLKTGVAAVRLVTHISSSPLPRSVTLTLRAHERIGNRGNLSVPISHPLGTVSLPEYTRDTAYVLFQRSPLPRTAPEALAYASYHHHHQLPPPVS